MLTSFKDWYKAPTNYGASTVHTIVNTLTKAQCFYLGQLNMYTAQDLAKQATANVYEALPMLEFDLRIVHMTHKRVTGITTYELDIYIDKHCPQRITVPGLPTQGTLQ